MRKLTVAIMVACVLLSANVGFAMTQKQLEDRRSQMFDALKHTQEVSWGALSNNENAYVGKVVKFRATCAGTDDPSVYLKDSNGNDFVILKSAYYKLKVGTEYTISAKFKKIVTADDGDKAAMFEYEEAHLPYLSEYGL